MSIVKDAVGEAFIIVAIVVGGLLLLAVPGYFLFRWWRKKKGLPTIEEKKPPESDKLDDSKHLSKISVNNWQSPERRYEDKPLVVLQDPKGQFHIKSPSIAEKSEEKYANLKDGNKVLLIDVARHHHLQQAGVRELGSLREQQAHLV